jgi:hypothetical protein
MDGETLPVSICETRLSLTPAFWESSFRVSRFCSRTLRIFSPKEEFPDFNNTDAPLVFIKYKKSFVKKKKPGRENLREACGAERHFLGEVV